MMGELSRHLRFALRRLVRSPGFTIAASLTLALGIGANTTIFTLIDSSLVRPLPYPRPDRLVVLWERQHALGKSQEKVSAQNFLDWRNDSGSFSDLAAWTDWGLALTGAGEPEELPTIRASANLFQLLGARPELGRGFLPEEETPGRDRVVVLSQALWARRFGADRSVIGRTVTLDGEPHTIVGVMPADFRFPGDASIALWAPLSFDAQQRVKRAERRFSVVGRLRDGVTLDQARAELGLISRHLAAAHPQTNAGWDVALVPAVEAAAAGSRRMLAILFASVGLVLLIACANVGHLLLARAVDREGELAIRVALGAAPTRLVELLLAESGLVAVLGTTLGVVLALWALPVIQTLDPGVLPRWREPRLDVRVLLYTSGLMLFTTLACGLVPAIRWLRRNAGTLPSPGGRLTTGIDRSRLQQGIIVGEVALSVVLLLGTGLLLRSLSRLMTVDPGFQADRVVATTIFLSPQYQRRHDQVAFFDRLLERLAHSPGIEAAGAVTSLPLNPNGIDYDLPFSPNGQPPANEAQQEQVDFRTASSDYFRVLGVPLLRGRWFGPQDREDSAPVVIVDQTLAERHFADGDPIGREVWIGGGIGRATVVGVVGSIRHRGLDALPRSQMYVPFRQYPHGGMTVVVRGNNDAAALAKTIKKQVYSIDAAQPVNDLVTMPQLVADSVSPRRFTLLLLGSFAGLAVILAAIGVYGVIAYAVSRRTREIGIRIALGARSREIRRAVAGRGLKSALVGVLLGSILGWMASQLLGRELYEISPHDPATFVAAGLLILVIAWAACELPARRARRIDPAISLRSE